METGNLGFHHPRDVTHPDLRAPSLFRLGQLKLALQPGPAGPSPLDASETFFDIGRLYAIV